MNAPPGNSASSLVVIEDPSAVGEARRLVQRAAGALGFDPTDAGRAALVVAELATNIVKHASRGRVIFRALQSRHRRGIEVLALDKGPGMANIAECMRDGYSTAGSPGTGMGAVGRLADTFEIYSAPDAGSAVLARLYETAAGDRAAERVRVGAVCVAMGGETHPGDGWAVAEEHSRVWVAVADGLGHGPLATEAAEAAIAAFHRRRDDEAPEALLTRSHAALRATRGAAVAIAAVDSGRGVVRHAGVGNIAARIVQPGSGGSRSLVSNNGTVGVEMRKVQPFSYPMPAGAVLILHSDGLGTRWDLARYPGLLARDPALVAGVLYRDYHRRSDDVTVLVLREGAAR